MDSGRAMLQVRPTSTTGFAPEIAREFAVKSAGA